MLGVVLRTRVFKEKHRSVSILTDEYGIIEAIQYGVSTGKALGTSQQFTSGTFHLYHNPVRESWKLMEVSDTTELHTISQDIHLLYGASFCAEVLLRTHIGGGDFQRMRKLFQETLELFHRGYPRDVVLIRFMWRFLHYMGVIDGVSRCVECESQLTNDDLLYLDEQIPGLVCQHCGHPTMITLSKEGRMLLLQMEQFSWSYLQEAKQLEMVIVEVKQLLLRVIELLSEGRLQTLSSGMV